MDVLGFSVGAARCGWGRVVGNKHCGFWFAERRESPIADVVSQGKHPQSPARATQN